MALYITAEDGKRQRKIWKGGGGGGQLTLVIHFRSVLSSKALILQGLIVHVELLHHVIVEFVPASPSAAPKSGQWDRGEQRENKWKCRHISAQKQETMRSE